MVLIFSGPTLPPQAAQRLFPEARCLPPAAQGDVYRACNKLPTVICLIDGYFEHRPAVTHKELLWALHRGVLVYGASSMGALRAAEMNTFGMRGWGKVFELFATGELENDDEVAIAHSEADRGFAPASEALVNMRLTLKAAAAEGVVSDRVADTLIEHARKLFYPDRQYARVIDAAAEAGVSRSELSGFERWLAVAGNRVDQKLKDASTLLAHVRTGLHSKSLPSKIRSFDFPYTEAWHELRKSIDEPSSDEPNDGVPSARTTLLDDLLEEVQLLGPETFQRVLSAATWRALCVSISAPAAGAPPGARSPKTVGSGAQPALGRIPEVPSRRWLADHDMVLEEHRRLIEEERRVATIDDLARSYVLSEIPNVLTLLGDYPKVAKRARDKRLHFAALAPRSDATDEAEALRSYFQERLGMPVPEDLTAFARSTGFASREQLVAAVCRDVEFMRRHE